MERCRWFIATWLVPVAAIAVPAMVAAGGLTACDTIDPGENFVVPNETFDADFFFCRVEPNFLVAKKCGSGDPAAGDRAGGCHYTASAVSGMGLIEHPAVDCGGTDRPLSRAALAPGSAAQANLQSVSLEMSRDVLTAPILVRPSGSKHPRVILERTDPVVDVLKRWAAR
jgi:hypothetical protein